MLNSNLNRQYWLRLEGYAQTLVIQDNESAKGMIGEAHGCSRDWTSRTTHVVVVTSEFQPLHAVLKMAGHAWKQGQTVALKAVRSKLTRCISLLRTRVRKMTKIIGQRLNGP